MARIFDDIFNYRLEYQIEVFCNVSEIKTDG